MTSIKTGLGEIKIEGELGGFKAELTTRQLKPGVEIVTMSLKAAKPEVPKPVSLIWIFPGRDIQCCWVPQGNMHNFLYVDWFSPVESEATDNAPVISLFNQAGKNRLTFACSDALNHLRRKAGLHEETGEFDCRLIFFTKPGPPIDHYEASLLLDTRDIPYYEALRGVQEWWSGFPLYKASPVPADAKLPMYSTWYSFHQAITAESIEKQCALSREVGCASVIVDDGWETSDENRGFAFAGDWQVAPNRIPDMKAHVARVHQLGMKYLLWYSVALMGKKTKMYQKFKDLALRDVGDWVVVDPRFPQIREYLIQTFEKAQKEWKLDGFKFDFVDSFALRDGDVLQYGQGRDYVSVQEAADRLLSDVMERLRKVNPDIMIEFRQGYIGPLMRKYGNMFRAGDCPYDLLQNRSRTLDIRLLCGNTAVHADPIMWNYDDPMEAGAMQLWNTLFAVPQVSMRLDKLSPAHLKMVRWYLSFWRENTDVLLDGVLKPLHPEAGYPLVLAETAGKRVIAVYADQVVDPGANIPAKLFVVNAAYQDRVVLEFKEDVGKRHLDVTDCLGEKKMEEHVEIKKGIFSIPVPPAGMISLERH